MGHISGYHPFVVIGEVRRSGNAPELADSWEEKELVVVESNPKMIGGASDVAHGFVIKGVKLTLRLGPVPYGPVVLFCERVRRRGDEGFIGAYLLERDTMSIECDDDGLLEGCQPCRS